MISRLHERARALDKKIALPEGEDPRTIQAAHWLVENRVARPVLIGAESTIHSVADSLGLAVPSSVPIIDPAQAERAQRYAQSLFQLRKHKGLTYEQAREVIQDVLYFGDMMVREGDADGCVAGAAHPSPDVIKAAIRVLGVAEGSALVSSFFLMVLPDGRPLTFADCGVNASPDPGQLASIGIDAADNHRFMTGEEPFVAFLSFSTKGSADSPEVDRVRQAVELAKSQRPDLQIDGEMQFDTAFVPSVGERKAPGSQVAGKANVLVFPDLNSGNIGYKITQRVGGAEAFGPVLQGLTKPANDLSRGADWEDIANVVAITAIQAGALEG
ncbi:MAG: phosphate acetyltransferase [Bacteroidota bacterium]